MADQTNVRTDLDQVLEAKKLIEQWEAAHPGKSISLGGVFAMGVEALRREIQEVHQEHSA